MQDLALRLCWNSGSGQAVTTDAVSENVISYGAAAPMVFLKRPVVIIQVVTAFTGMASGMFIEGRADTAAALTTAPEILGHCGNAAVPLTTTDLAANAKWQMALNPKQLAASYQYFGIYFNLVSEAATAGNIIAWIDEAGESEY